MKPAFLGNELDAPQPVNNLRTLASDYNWVEEMALLTRFDPRNQVLKFGNHEWRRCGESEGERKEERVRREKEEAAEKKSTVDEDRDTEGVAVEVHVEVEDEVKTMRPKRKAGGDSTGVRPQLR